MCKTQRQQFDTKYAALYHPWLLIPDPYPVNLSQIADYPIPPSGHMVGIYARTDIERGVHKAPANEVVRGITGLQRILNKEQHDILNPYPVNINVIRDFRDNNRGIRVYGGRIITSDSDWKYVNVRRLLIFIEASIDRGLQWVVFEPNARAVVGARAPFDFQFPDFGLAQRRLGRDQGRRGVLRQMRSHDHDADGYRQRPADLRGRRCAGETRRIRDRPHRPVDGARG